MVAAAAGVPAVAAMALEAALAGVLAVALQVRAARASASRVPAALLDQHLGRGLVPSCRGLRRRAAWAHGNDLRAPGADSQPGPPPTTPLPPPSVSPEDTRALSRAQWGRARAEVDAELRERYRTGTTTAPSSRPPWPHSGYGCCARPAKANTNAPARGFSAVASLCAELLGTRGARCRGSASAGPETRSPAVT
jgi:hypothetical protein